MSKKKYGVTDSDPGFKKLKKELSKPQVIHLPNADSFIKNNTRFNGLESMLEECGIEALDDSTMNKWDHFISENSEFTSWDNMLKAITIDRIKE